jgi:hypothetical protein
MSDLAGNQLKSGFARYAVPYAVGLALPILVALTWSPSGHRWAIESLLRSYTAPVLAAELFAIIVALREGLLTELPRWKWWRPGVLAALILLAVALATMLRAPARTVAMIMTAYWIVHAFFAVAIAYLTGRIFAAGDLVRALMVGFGVFAVEFFVFVAAIPDWNAFDWKYSFMAFNHVRHAGYYLAAIAALSTGAMAVWKWRIGCVWAWLSTSLSFGIALWTGSRGAALAVAATLLAGILLIPTMRKARAWAGGLSAMAAALGAVWLAPAAPSGLMGLSHAFKQTVSGDVTTGRTTIWINVIGAIRKQPIFGYGEGQMHWVAPTWTMAQPHNSILQVALAWGLVGLVCVIVLATAYARRAIPAVRREGGELVPALMAMIAIAILSLYDASLYYALPQSIFAACGAVIASRWSVGGGSPNKSG